jgi:hypothetical protein
MIFWTLYGLDRYLEGTVQSDGMEPACGLVRE